MIDSEVRNKMIDSEVRNMNPFPEIKGVNLLSKTHCNDKSNLKLKTVLQE